MNACIFCEIVTGRAPCHQVWEDAEHLAFLSIFPNTPGVTIVIPKVHYQSYAFDLPDDILVRLVLVAKRVAQILDAKLEDVGRTGLIFEGFGVDHVHAKLIPMHGTHLLEWRQILSTERRFLNTYCGYLSSHDGPRADDAELSALAARLRDE